jgi:hypothetical protein
MCDACAISGGTTHECKESCRQHVNDWIDIAINIINNNAGTFTVIVDCLKHSPLKIVLAQTLVDTEQAQAIFDIYRSLNFNGTFNDLYVNNYTSITLSGLYSKFGTPDINAKDLNLWEKWALSQSTMDGWSPKNILISHAGNDDYLINIIENIMDVKTTVTSKHVSRDDCKETCRAFISDKLSKFHFRYSQLFYNFDLKTRERWSLHRRRGLASILNSITNTSGCDDIECKWLSRTILTTDPYIKWSFPVLGPRQPAYTGQIHVKTEEFVWHKLMKMEIMINLDESIEFDSINFIITTSW